MIAGPPLTRRIAARLIGPLALPALLAVSSSAAVAQTPRGALSGVVLDEKARPIAGAEVLLPKIAGRLLTNDRGEFRFTDLAPGAHDLVVRRIGYVEFSAVITLPADRGVQREIFLKPLATLDTVSVTASAVIPSFEENRRIGLGKFLTRAELEKQENRKMSEILFDIGARTLKNGPRAWVGGEQRGPKSFGNSRQICKELEGREPKGDPRSGKYSPNDPGCSCFALVYVNDHMIYDGRVGGLVPDINFIVPSTIEAIEYYKGPAQTPLRYSTLNSECGVLVFHTRRTPGSVSKP